MHEVHCYHDAFQVVFVNNLKVIMFSFLDIFVFFQTTISFRIILHLTSIPYQVNERGIVSSLFYLI